MISFCRNYLVQLLTDLGITPVYTRPEDASRYKGLRFSLAICGTEKLEKDGSRAARNVNTETKTVQNRRRLYHSTLPILVDLVGKNLDDAEGYRQSFIQKLDTRLLDPDGNAIGIEVTQCDVVQEESIQNPREGFEITVVFTGGIYTDSTSILIQADQLKPEIVFEEEEST